jgi:hypothetical protein
MDNTKSVNRKILTAEVLAERERTKKSVIPLNLNQTPRDLQEKQQIDTRVSHQYRPTTATALSHWYSKGFWIREVHNPFDELKLIEAKDSVDSNLSLLRPCLTESVKRRGFYPLSMFQFWRQDHHQATFHSSEIDNTDHVNHNFGIMVKPEAPSMLYWRTSEEGVSNSFQLFNGRQIYESTEEFHLILTQNNFILTNTSFARSDFDRRYKDLYRQYRKDLAEKKQYCQEVNQEELLYQGRNSKRPTSGKTKPAVPPQPNFEIDYSEGHFHYRSEDVFGIYVIKGVHRSSQYYYFLDYLRNTRHLAVMEFIFDPLQYAYYPRQVGC